MFDIPRTVAYLFSGEKKTFILLNDLKATVILFVSQETLETKFRCDWKVV